jgi:hypothetical protein
VVLLGLGKSRRPDGGQEEGSSNESRLHCDRWLTEQGRVCVGRLEYWRRGLKAG